MDKQALTSPICAKMNPSRQFLVGKHRDYLKRLSIYRSRHERDLHKDAIIAACQSHLDDIACMLHVKCSVLSSKSFAIWHLFHRVDEYFYLLMNEAELKAQGWELLQGLKISPISLQTKTDWIVKIQETMNKLDDPKQSPTPDERLRLLSETSQILNSAAYIHNDCVDNLFWDYWCRKLFSLIYIAGLLVAILLLFMLYYHSKFTLCASTALLIGAVGGLLSGIMTSQIDSIPYGQFWVNLFYHAIVRPLQGAIAALMVFWMLQSQYLVKIEPPLQPGRVIFNSTSSCRVEMPVTTSPKSVASSFQNKTSSGKSTATETKSDPLLVLKAAPGMQVYLYMLVLLIAGFSGDKALRYVSDKVSSRLFAEAEKTKEAK